MPFCTLNIINFMAYFNKIWSFFRYWRSFLPDRMTSTCTLPGPTSGRPFRSSAPHPQRRESPWKLLYWGQVKILLEVHFFLLILIHGKNKKQISSMSSTKRSRASIEDDGEGVHRDPVIGLDVCGKVFYCYQSKSTGANVETKLFDLKIPHTWFSQMYITQQVHKAK